MVNTIIALSVLLIAAVAAAIYFAKKAERNRIVTTIYGQIVNVAAWNSDSFFQIGWGISYIRKHCRTVYDDKLPEVVRIISLRTGLGFPNAYLSTEFLNVCDTAIKLELAELISGRIHRFIYSEIEGVDIRMQKVVDEYVTADARKEWHDFIGLVKNSFYNFSDIRHRQQQEELFQQKVLQRKNELAAVN